MTVLMFLHKPNLLDSIVFLLIHISIFSFSSSWNGEQNKWISGSQSVSLESRGCSCVAVDKGYDCAVLLPCPYTHFPVLSFPSVVENGQLPDPADWAFTDVVNYFKAAGFDEQATAFQDQVKILIY